jgi:hypothetical protein
MTMPIFATLFARLPTRVAPMLKITGGLALLVSLLGCSTPDVVTLDEHQLGISSITIEQLGKPLADRPTMVSVCSGFLLSENQVRDFFKYANYIKESTPSPYYQKLPCYSSGTAKINEQTYQWVIHAGGIGEFYNDTDRFVKVCGKNCCNKVANIC